VFVSIPQSNLSQNTKFCTLSVAVFTYKLKFAPHQIPLQNRPEDMQNLALRTKMPPEGGKVSKVRKSAMTVDQSRKPFHP
jgi:hypothetical protein